MNDEPAGFAEELPKAGSRRGQASDWREQNAQASRGKLVAITFILMLGVAGAIGGLVLWPTKPLEARLVTMPANQYGTFWPVNAWAERDSSLLAEGFGELGSKAFNYQQADKFRIWLDWLAAKPGAVAADLPADLAARPLLIHLTCFSAVDDNGLHVLLPGTETTVFSRSVEWIKLDLIMEAIRICPAQQKLLFLDIAHPIANPFNGILIDDAARMLDDYLLECKRAQRLPCPVLTACGPGQVSLPCDPEGMSVFAFYIREGLSGLADGILDGKRDEIVRVGELVRFVQTRVERWSRLCAAAPQNPTLHVNDDSELNFVATYRQARRGNAYDVAQARQYPSELAAVWMDVRQLGAGTLPVVQSSFSAALLRAESMWTRSGHPDRAESAWREVRQHAAKLSMESAATAASADEQIKRASRFRIREAPELSPEESAKIRNGLMAMLLSTAEDEAKTSQAWKALAAEHPEAAMNAVWKAVLTAERPERKEFRRWSAAMGGMLPPTAESIMLDRLANFDFEAELDLARPPREALAALVKAEASLGRLAAATSEGFGQYEAELTRAESRRQSAEKALFQAKSHDDVQSATNELIAATAEFDGILQRLSRRQAALENIRSARSVVLNTMTASIQTDAPRFATWKKTVSTLTTVLNAMDAQRANPALADATWGGLIPELVRLSGELEAQYVPATVKVMLERAPAERNAAETQVLANLLMGPALDGMSRELVWNAHSAAIAALHRKVRKQDELDDEMRPAVPAPVRDASPERFDIPLRRAEAAVALLELAGAIDRTESEAGLRSVLADPSNRTNWLKLGQSLLNDWHVKLPQLARDQSVAGNHDVVDRILNAVPADAARYGAFTGSTASRQLAQQDAVLHRRWILNQLIGDEPLRSRTDAARRFYDTVRSELLSP